MLPLETQEREVTLRRGGSLMVTLLCPMLPVSCGTFAIRSSVCGVTGGTSSKLSEPQFPDLLNGSPDTDVSGEAL